MILAGSIASSRRAHVPRCQIDAREINHDGDVGSIPFATAQRRRARAYRLARIEDHAVRPRQLGAEIANRGPLDRHCNGRRILGMCRFRDERREVVTTLLVDQVPEDVLMIGFSDDRPYLASS